MSMKANMKRALTVVAAATLSALSFSAQSADPTKVGFVYVGPIGDLICPDCDCFCCSAPMDGFNSPTSRCLSWLVST